MGNGSTGCVISYETSVGAVVQRTSGQESVDATRTWNAGSVDTRIGARAIQAVIGTGGASGSVLRTTSVCSTFEGLTNWRLNAISVCRIASVVETSVASGVLTSGVPVAVVASGRGSGNVTRSDGERSASVTSGGGCAGKCSTEEASAVNGPVAITVNL